MHHESVETTWSEVVTALAVMGIIAFLLLLWASVTYACWCDQPKSHHYAFHVSEVEFEAIFDRVKARGIPYGSGPYSRTDGQIYSRRGGRGFYFDDPNGHVLEVMTVPETGS
jgi:Glyoxalase/Bleomycin resistance protein/Dioxygenase superfamily